MIIKILSEPNKKSLWTAIAWSVLILLLSFKAPAVNPKYIFSHQDKVVHFTFYFVFVFLWYRYLVAINRIQKSKILFLVLLSVSMGILIELAQGYLTTTRNADIFDVMANSFGSLLGIIFSNQFFKKENQE